jgi:hypothetical protein
MDRSLIMSQPAPSSLCATFSTGSQEWEVRASESGLGIAQADHFLRNLSGIRLPCAGERLAAALSAEDGVALGSDLCALAAFLDAVGNRLQGGLSPVEAVHEALKWRI